jgi:hypothetical protein
MPTEIIVALIAFIGILVSVLVSVLTSMRVINTELQRLRTEIQQTYAGKLLEKRLEVYPDMYYLLSDFIKKVQFHDDSKIDMDEEVLEELRAQTNEWNSRYSLFFSGETNLTSTKFRKLLDDLIKSVDKDTVKKIPTEALRPLRHEAGHFELALKSDLGIFVVEFSDPAKRFTSYTELMGTVTKK